MRAFFEGIQTIFVDFLFKPWDLLRSLELSNWWLANILTWISIGICMYYTIYWCKELKKHQDNNEEDLTSTAHSFLE